MFLVVFFVCFVLLCFVLFCFISDEAETFGSQKSKFPMFYKVVIGCFEPLDQAGFLVIKTFAMSTYVLYQKVRLLKRFPEPLPDPPHPSPDF